MINRRTMLAASAAFAATATGQQNRVSYWHHFVPPEARGLNRVEALFAERTGGLRVASDAIPQAEFMTKLTAAVMANSRPDTGMVTAFRSGDMVNMGALVDITDRINGWSGRDAFGERAWQPVTHGGKIYAVPCMSFVNWMYYRKDLFEQAGIAGPPDTHEQFVDACIKLTNAGQNRYGFGLRGGPGGHGFLIDQIRAWGSPIVEEGRMAMDRAKAIEGVRAYAELFTRHRVAPPSAPNDGYRQMMDGFKTGQTAMIWHHTGSLTEIMPALGEDKVGTAIRPAGPVARIAQVEYGYNGIMNPRTADNGWKWISFWADPDAALAFLEETGYFPASTAAANDPRVTGRPIFNAARETLRFGVAQPNFAGYDAWATQVAWPAFQRILIGQSTVEVAVDTMMRGLERALR